MTAAVAASQRFTARHPCPVCAGHAALPEGQGRRCWGFISADGAYAHCARDEHAGKLSAGSDSMFAHRLSGPCDCGVEHRDRPIAAPRGNGTERRIVRERIYRVGAFEHVRRDYEGGEKSFAWRQPDGTLGLGGVPVADLPLYSSEGLADAPASSMVLVVEGEKCCDALTARGFLAVGTSTGAKVTPSDASLGALRDFDLVLWPDADGDGQAHMGRIAGRLRLMGIPCRILTWLDAPLHGDAADYIARGGPADELRELMDAAPVYDGPGSIDAKSAVSGTESTESTLSMGLVQKPSRIWSAAELMAADLPEPLWVVPGLLPEGLTVFAGRPKMGKSWLVLSLGIAVSSGGCAMGKVDVLDGGDVLYLALEDNAGRLQSRLRTVLAGALPPVGLHLVTEWSRLSDGGLEALGTWLQSHPGTRFVILDTFAKVRPRRQRNGDIYSEDHAAGAMLAELAARHHVAVLVVHHQRKMGADDWVDTISGSLGLAAAADSLWALIRERGRADAVLHITGRDVEEKELALTWEANLASWALAGPAAEFRLSEERRQIVEFVRAADEPVSPKQVSDALGKNASTTRNLLRYMVKDGELRSTAAGKYQRVDTVDAVDSAPNKYEGVDTVDSLDSVPEMPVSSLWGAGSVDSRLEVIDL